MSVKRFSKGEAIRFGWETTKSNLGFFIGLLLIVFIIAAFFSGFGSLFEESLPFLSLIFNLGSLVFNLIISIGFIKVALKFYDGKKGEFGDFFTFTGSLLLTFFAGSLLFGLIIVLGYILLIIPGIILMIKLQFFNYFIVDKDMGPIEALQASWGITKGVKWELFLFMLLLGLLNIAGFLLFIVGLFISIPITILATAYVYRKLSTDAGSIDFSEPQDSRNIIKEF